MLDYLFGIDSVSCRVRETESASSGYIMVNVRGIDGALQISDGDIIFSYHVSIIEMHYRDVGVL